MPPCDLADRPQCMGRREPPSALAAAGYDTVNRHRIPEEALCGSIADTLSSLKQPYQLAAGGPALSSVDVVLLGHREGLVAEQVFSHPYVLRVSHRNETRRSVAEAMRRNWEPQSFRSALDDPAPDHLVAHGTAFKRPQEIVRFCTREDGSNAFQKMVHVGGEALRQTVVLRHIRL